MANRPIKKSSFKIIKRAYITKWLRENKQRQYDQINAWIKENKRRRAEGLELLPLPPAIPR